MHRFVTYNTDFLFCLAVVATWVLLAPGLSGGFIFDDYNNLKGLAKINEDPGLRSSLQYVSNGLFSAIGRPLSLATFAVQHNHWPDNPGAFKTANLVLHLLNGTLLYLLLIKIGRLRDDGPAAVWVALIAASLWLIHPIQLSTALYIVQRMTELSAFFVLLGLWLYLHGREAGANSNARPHTAFLFMSLGIFMGLGLGVLSKENAALMPLLVLVAEFTLLASIKRPSFWKAWSAALLVLPTLLLAGYLILKIGGFAKLYAIRDFSFSERLFTESRILLDYLGKILLPSPDAFGLLFDDFPISRGLLDPPVTLLAIAIILAMLGIGIAVRKQQPVLSFAILWFFAAHLLESTVIPLELYYEHRNYIACIGPILAIVHYTRALFGKLRNPVYKVLAGVCVTAYVGLLLLISHQDARLWGDPMLQATVWTRAHPDSKRSSYLYANELLKRGFADSAARLYRKVAQKWPDSAAGLIASMEATCFLGAQDPASIAAAARRLRAQRTEANETILFLSRLVTIQSDGDCPTMAARDSLALLESTYSNPYFANSRHLILVMRSQIHRAAGEPGLAIEDLNAAFRMRPDYQKAIDISNLYVEMGRPDQARQFINDAIDNAALMGRAKHLRQSDLQRLLDQLDAAEHTFQTTVPAESRAAANSSGG